MASFQAKTGWKWPTKRECKNYRSAPFLLDAKQKIPKKQKKIKKVKKYHYGCISSQKQFGKRGERDKIKIIVTFHSYPTRNLKFPKNSNKIQKIKIYHYGFISSPKQVGKGREREKIKIIGPFRSYTTRNRKFQKNSNKIQKYHYGIISSQNRLENAEKERI